MTYKGGSLRNRRKGRGLRAKHPFFLLPFTGKQRRGPRGVGGGLAGETRRDGGRGEGEKGEGAVMDRFPHLIWAEVACGGVAAVAGGGGRW